MDTIMTYAKLVVVQSILAHLAQVASAYTSTTTKDGVRAWQKVAGVYGITAQRAQQLKDTLQGRQAAFVPWSDVWYLAGSAKQLLRPGALYDNSCPCCGRRGAA